MTDLKQAAPAESDVGPVAWIESPHGVIRANPRHKFVGPHSVAWSIPLYPHPPTEQKPADPEMLKDAQRFQWLADNALAVDMVSDPDGAVEVWHDTDRTNPTIGATLRKAVDRAMGGDHE